MKKLMIMAVAVAGLTSGCISVNKNEGGDDRVTPKVIKDVVHEKYKLADKTITVENTIHAVCNFITWGNQATHIADQAPNGTNMPWITAEQAAMNGAYAIACEQAKADAIVSARYKVTVDDYVVYKKVHVELTGYPAMMTGIEMLDATKILPCPNTK